MENSDPADQGAQRNGAERVVQIAAKWNEYLDTLNEPMSQLIYGLEHRSKVFIIPHLPFLTQNPICRNSLRLHGHTRSPGFDARRRSPGLPPHCRSISVAARLVEVGGPLRHRAWAPKKSLEIFFIPNATTVEAPNKWNAEASGLSRRLPLSPHPHRQDFKKNEMNKYGKLQVSPNSSTSSTAGEFGLLVKYGQAALAKKGEDYFLTKPNCERIAGDPSTSSSVFAIFDGHNGILAAIFAKENLLANVLSAIARGVGPDDWHRALLWTLVAGETSGTMVTFVVIDGWTIIVASVGESRCILDTWRLVPSVVGLVDYAFQGKKSQSVNKATGKLSAVGAVVELFEEGSAMLAERLGKDFPSNQNPGTFKCAVCQADQPPC
ncbi:hypothetical protein NL676_020084 [Syzygium grande]|nr:hypothetical protein NL676_020084 [Syzygium grande]